MSAVLEQKQPELNSVEYWDKRFASDWQERNGRAQSRFFARLAAEALPHWLASCINDHRMSLCDWGCAFGDGTDVLKSALGQAKITGVDFSNVAIDEARASYPQISFDTADLLGEDDWSYDVVFSSNTLEHFADPWERAARLAKGARNFLVLALPFQEYERIDEHEATFDFSTIPAVVGDNMFLVDATPIDCRELDDTHWRGLQIVLVYASAGQLQDLDLSYGDLSCGFMKPLNFATLPEALEQRMFHLASKHPAFPRAQGGQSDIAAAVERVVQLASSNGVLAARLKAFDNELAQARARAQEAESKAETRVVKLRCEADKDIQQARAEADARVRQGDNEAGERLQQVRSEADADIQQARSEVEREIAARQEAQARLAEAEAGLVELHDKLGAIEALNAGDGALDEATYRLGVLRMSRAWRLARIAQYVNAEILSPKASGRFRATKILLARAVLGKPLGAYDALRTSEGLIERFRLRLAESTGGRAPRWRAEQDGECGTRADAEQSSQPAAPAGRVDVARGTKGRVSIVLPVFNQADMLPEAIDGVLAQSYRNWQLIIVNDGSADDFDAAVAPYLADARLTVLEQPNQRLPSALNNGFAHARGEFATWTSADNIMEPAQIERLVRALHDNPRAGLAYSDYLAIDDRAEPLKDPSFRPHNRAHPTSPEIKLPSSVTVANFHDSGDNFLGASFLYRADIAAVAGRYDENTFGGEDYDFWLRLHLLTPFVHVPECLYRYRVHDKSLNAKAAELNLAPNIKIVTDADKERRAASLANEALVVPPAEATQGRFWRNPAQYRGGVSTDYDLRRYSRLSDGHETADERLQVIVIDVALRRIDTARLARADVIVAPDELAYFWLRRQPLAPHIRLLAGEPDLIAPAIGHAIALRRFERRQEARGHVMASKPPALPKADHGCGHALMLIGKWRNGGMEQVVLDVATGLAKKGVRATLGVADEAVSSELAKIATAAGLEVRGFSGKATALADFVSTERVDVVNYHHATLGAAALKAAQVPSVYTFHNSYIWFNDVERAAWRDALRDMTASIAVSRQVASYARAWFDIDPAHCFVVPNGVDLASAAANHASQGRGQSAKNTAGSEIRFLNVATFNRVKLQDRLLQAFARVVEKNPKARLTLVGGQGDKRYFDEVMSLRRRLGLDAAVTIESRLGRADVLALMGTHQCFVLPSLLEGWSISLMEAMAQGMPVIASDVGSARDLAGLSKAVTVIPSLCGELEELNDRGMWAALDEQRPEFDERLAAAMLDLCDSYEGRALSAAAAVAAVQQRCSLDAMVEGYIDCFREARSAMAGALTTLEMISQAPADGNTNFIGGAQSC